MLKIADKSGKVLFTLKDEDDAPEIKDEDAVKKLKESSQKTIKNEQPEEIK